MSDNCFYCGHPHDAHPPSKQGGIRCNGVVTQGESSLCGQCRDLAADFLNPDTTLGIIWRSIFNDANAYFLPGLAPINQWDQNEARAAAWADIATWHIHKDLNESKAHT